MVGESSDGPVYTAMRVMINLAALGLCAATIALIVATVIAETD
ncbi:MAG: hypothetical protein WD904_06825 [Dehalococcoidia bacterium]